MDVKSEKMNINAANMLHALDNTDISIFLYYPKERKIEVPEKVCRQFHCDPVYTDMPDSFAKTSVYPDDRAGFIEMYGRIHNGENTASSKFRSMDQSICVRDTLTTVAWDENGNPDLVMGVISDASDSYQIDQLIEKMQERIQAENTANELSEVMQIIAASIGGLYYAIYHIWMESRTYVCFHEKMEGVLSAIGEKGAYDPAWDIYVKNYIVPEDQAALREFAEISTLPERLRSNHSISHIYRRNGVGWTRGTFIASKRDETGNVTNVIYTVTDINAEVEQEEKQKQALFEASHDSLTGVYNRKGFEAILASEKAKTGNIGFAILDIDNFKSINDNFGHVIGDQILVAVAEQLTSVIYPNDILARIGGDEFAVLFWDCDASAWNKICSKFQTVHTILANRFQKTHELSITLSVGITFSASGYRHLMYQLADEGLYETKKLGRAGCTMIGTNHEVLKHWQDESLSLLAKNVMEYNNTGICQIEIPDDPHMPRRLSCGDTARLILGFPRLATPEECYSIFRDRIDPSYRETLILTEQTMRTLGQTECTFLWNHPDHGRIHLRCGGYAVKRDGQTILSGYCHVLKETHIIERQNDQIKVLQAVNNTFLSSYYLNLEENTATAYKLGPGADYIPPDTNTIPELMDGYISTIIDPRDRDLMRDFLDMQTLQDRLQTDRFLDAEYRSSATQSWCRARLIPVRYDADGRLSHVLLTVTALDSRKLKEAYTLDYNRRSLAALFDNLPCGIVMYEWKNQSIELVHVSRYFEENSGHRFIKPDKNGRFSPNNDCVHPEDQAEYQKALDLAVSEPHGLHHEYRAWDDKRGRYIWERVDAVFSAQQNGSLMIFAVYTDITRQKEQELQLEKSHASLLAALDASNQLCYEYDPLLHTGECLTEENFFGLPKFIENYPDSLKEIGLFHPEDADTFIETAYQIDEGNDYSQCDVRIKKDGNFGWYSCTFNRYLDSEKNRHVAILTVVDISLRIASQKTYETRLRSLISPTENTMCMSIVNLTKKTYEVVQCIDSVRPFVNTTLPLEEFLVYASRGIVREDDRRKFCEMFQINGLLQQVANGNLHQEIEYLFKTDESHYEWIHSAIDLIQNPATGEVTGAVYSKSMQTEKIDKMLLEKTLEQDYLFVAAIFTESDEFYLYNYHNDNSAVYMQHFWDIALSNMAENCSEEIQKELKTIFTKENVLRQLEQQSQYCYAYNGMIAHKTHRLEIRFSYADASHTMLLASMRNITDASLLEKYRHDSEHDVLTGLYNRKKFISECEQMLKEHPEEQFAMIHFDLKNFHRYNTFFGDAAGDQLLCDLADVLRSANGDYDHWVYGRIDADVFCSMVPFDQKLYEKHTQATFRYLSEYRNDYLLEPKFGLYLIKNPKMPIESMITRAAIPAKKEQTNATRISAVYNDKMEEQLQTEQRIVNGMQNALDQGQFQVYLQPKYALRTGQPVGAEALVRWIHPKKGVISPAEFIPIFEKNGFIANLDRYMWEQTCILLRKWMDEGKTVNPISVNVSRISIFGPNTVSFLKELVEKYRIEPRYLELELTESAYVESPEEILSRLTTLQQYGFKILMDDFGKGYSSLNTLKDLPIDFLKLDMKFLFSGENARGSKILVSVLRMSKLLNIPVIAEGVETKAQAGYLRSIGCEYVQGYLYARPMPAVDYEKEIAAMPKGADAGDASPQRYSPAFDALLSDTTAAQLIGDAIPSPLALIGSQNSQFTLLRANQAFIDTFGLREDLRPANRIIQEHLSAEDYDRVLRAFQSCSETKASVSFHVGWKNDKDDTVRQYLVSTAYEGHFGTEQVFAAVFIDEKPKDYFV